MKEFEDGNSQEILRKRLGKYRRVKEIPFLDLLSRECSKRGIDLLFDVNDIHSNRKCLIYTEFMGALGGLMIRSPNAFIREEMYKRSLNGYIENDFTRLEYGDKYFLKKEEERNVDNLIILPGSNKLQKTISIANLVRKAIEGDRVAHIKPHPLTNKKDLGILNDYFGNYVIDKESRCWELFKASKKVYLTTFSEFSLYSILLDKEFEFIDKNDNECGSYKSLNIFLSKDIVNRKENLNKMLNNGEYSGLFFDFNNNEQEVVNYLDNFEEVYNEQV